MTRDEVAKANAERFDATIRKFVPKWKVIAKADSKLHRAIGFVLQPLLPYMTRFWTTIGFTAAYPSEDNSWQVRPHEGRHGMQAKRWTRLGFGFLYLFPQTLMPIFALLAFLFSSTQMFTIFCVLAVGSLMPWPAPFRMWFELHAYQLSIMILAWEGYSKEYVEEQVKYMANELFAGPSYFFMWPGREYIMDKLMHAYEIAAEWDEPWTNKFALRTDPYHIAIYETYKG